MLKFYFNASPDPAKVALTISARPAAIRANVLKDRFTFKAEMDAEGRRIMFRHIVKG